MYVRVHVAEFSSVGNKSRNVSDRVLFLPQTFVFFFFFASDEMFLKLKLTACLRISV